MQLSAASSPPLSLVAPFLFAAPLGLLAAGILLGTTDSSSLAGINVPRNVAATHAAVIGTLTTAIMGAVYQLGPAVLGGRLISHRLARAQFGVHAISIPAFVWALLEWNTALMAVAACAVLASFAMFLVNALPAVGVHRPNSVTSAYLMASLLLLVVTASFGITWVSSLQGQWFPVTMGRLSGHAHLGLLGWLSLSVMGVSYQLVPMFNVVQKRQQRFAWAALALTASAALAGGLYLMTDPGRGPRLVIAIAMALGPALWGIDILRLLLGRARRKLDVQGRATLVSLGFLAVAILLGMVVAAGEPFRDGDHPARWQLAYGICGIGGWAALTLVGNSFKLLPFLVWYHRYRSLAGTGRVPMITDIYSDRWATAVLGGYAIAFALMVVGAASAGLPLLRLGSWVLALSAAGHFATLGHILLVPHKAAVRPGPFGKGAML